MSLKTRADCDVLHLGCGEDIQQDAWNVDYVEGVDPDEVYNLNEYPWPWDSGWTEIRAHHVFEHLPDIERALRECARLLEPKGKLEMSVPFGLDAQADPDHTWGQTGTAWTWRTPEFLCGKRHWDTDVGLKVEERGVDIWSMLPRGWQRGVVTKLYRWQLNRHGPGPWCFDLPCSAGEFHITFRKPP